MPTLSPQLDLERCPHCRVDRPALVGLQQWPTTDHRGHNPRWWKVYKCSRCGGLVSAAAPGDGAEVSECYPSPGTVDDALPAKAKELLAQALNSLHAPVGAVMLAASAIDAMLKVKGLTEGSLYTRIDKAAADHMITAEMATWAHNIRLDANDQRHADQNAPLPQVDDARRCVDFASVLGMILFTLPARVTRGLAATGGGGVATKAG